MKTKTPIRVLIIVTAACLALSVLGLATAMLGNQPALECPQLLGFGLRFRLTGFQALYAFLACLMWFCTSVFARDYMAHGHALTRYVLFTLLTLLGTVGVLLSDSLYTTFVFFELMSLCSYPWVAHEETPEAMRAAQTYLYIAIIGGLCMLMGLLLLPQSVATASYAGMLPKLPWASAILLLIGFGAKAGSFPLHIWLPKAHPVAPAPASALLSGMLTKNGVFGMLLLTCRFLQGDANWGALIFWLGVVTMLLGAALALCSDNLKRVLACSSLSQIGFIMIGVGLQGLLGEDGGLAAMGTVGHMVNHSLFKLVLFTCAGVVYMNTHALTLREIQGFGRGKPALHVAFLLAMLGIAGVPLLSGYLSKSLLHEGILEYIAALSENGLQAGWYCAAEWMFLTAGGMTLAYMLKLYVTLFLRTNEKRQEEFNGMKKYMSTPLALTLVGSALLVPMIGLMPHVFMDGFGRLSQGFLNAKFSTVSYFSVENLLGAGKSLLIGAALYFALVRPVLLKRGNVLPAWLDMENSLYRPLLAALAAVGYGFAYVCDRLLDWATPAMIAVGTFGSRVCDELIDGVTLLCRKTVLRKLRTRKPVPVGNRFTYALGSVFDAVVLLLNKTLYRHRPIQTRFVYVFAAGQEEMSQQTRRLTRSISFGLLMFCIGLYVTLWYLLFQ